MKQPNNMSRAVSKTDIIIIFVWMILAAVVIWVGIAAMFISALQKNIQEYEYLNSYEYFIHQNEMDATPDE